MIRSYKQYKPNKLINHGNQVNGLLVYGFMGFSGVWLMGGEHPENIGSGTGETV